MKQHEKTVHVGLEKFSGRQIEYATWKDKLLTYVAKLDLDVENELFEKGLPEPKVDMRDFLESTPPHLLDEDVKAAPEEEQKAMRREIMCGERRMLPCAMFSTRLYRTRFCRPCQKTLETWRCTNRWNRILSSNWRDTMTLFSQLNQARNEMNRKSKKVLGREMMTETMMCVQVLAQLPCEIWASSIELTKASFTAEKVEISLNKLFGDKSKKAIVGQNEPGSVTCINYVKKGTKKRKSHVNPVFKVKGVFTASAKGIRRPSGSA
ncbi:hypothetical protein F442_18160 [Phytophthora nicotianae P10297]|uniref:Uncharacterized protein n=1 Tax=Phytophthora nicotianae P10297 TaxID=1317064 RepID=W2YES5_PHYNI|nr:hypothetical protein F442_18160 [Phytophthora nicotianae P10297]